jgi:hypothetical protein
MSDKPAFKYEAVDRGKIFKVCEILGLDIWQIKSIHIEADAIDLVIFEFDEDGNRFFTDPEGKEGWAKYTATIKVH